MALVSFETLRVAVGHARAKTARVTGQLDLTGADVVGYLGVLGSYRNPAMDTTATLTTGQDPAAVVTWPDTARAAIDVEMADPSGTIDPSTDIRHWPVEDPDDPNLRAFEFSWINDPGADVDLDIIVSKFV